MRLFLPKSEREFFKNGFEGMGSANFMEMQQRMQRELMSNPDTLRQVR